MTQAIEKFISEARKHFDLQTPSGKIVFSNDIQHVIEWPTHYFQEFSATGKVDFSKITSYFQVKNIGALYFGDSCPDIILNKEKQQIILEYPYRDEGDLELLSYNEDIEPVTPGYESQGTVELELWWLFFCDYNQYKALHNLTDEEVKTRDNIVVVEWDKESLTINSDINELTTVLS